MGRYSTLRGRRLSFYEDTVERFAGSRAGAWLFLHALHPVDRRLLALTRGRLSLAVGAPVGLLETVGARSGCRRRTPLLYVADGDALVIVASNGGNARQPAWLHNLRAHPEVRFLTREHRWRSYRANVAAGSERAALWQLVNDLYAGYAIYQARAPERDFPVVVLTRMDRRPRAW